MTLFIYLASLLTRWAHSRRTDVRHRPVRVFDGARTRPQIALVTLQIALILLPSRLVSLGTSRAKTRPVGVSSTQAQDTRPRRGPQRESLLFWRAFSPSLRLNGRDELRGSLCDSPSPRLTLFHYVIVIVNAVVVVLTVANVSLIVVPICLIGLHRSQSVSVFSRMRPWCEKGVVWRSDRGRSHPMSRPLRPRHSALPQVLIFLIAMSNLNL